MSKKKKKAKIPIVLDSATVRFTGVALEAIAAGAAVDIRLNIATGRMTIEPLSTEELRRT